MNAPEILSTRGAAPGDRLAMWGNLLWRRFGSLQSEAYGDPQFEGRLELGTLADLRLCRIDASRHMVIRTRNEVRRDGRGDLKVVAQMEGSACFEQGGRRVVLRPGDWSVYDTEQSYVVTNPSRVTHMVMLLPRERLRGIPVPLQSVTVRRFGGGAGVSGAAFGLLRESLDRARSASDGEAARAADDLAGLIVDAMLEIAGVPTGRSLREAARGRILAYIDANLGDPRMTLDRVAEAAGCSKRNLHKLFHDEGETLGERIWRARLARVRDDLAAPRLRGRSITDIAFSWGFSSSAHFSRVFKERYGISPRRFRARACRTGVPAA